MKIYNNFKLKLSKLDYVSLITYQLLKLSEIFSSNIIFNHLNIYVNGVILQKNVNSKKK